MKIARDALLAFNTGQDAWCARDALFAFKKPGGTPGFLYKMAAEPQILFRRRVQ
jgi:hypothetical protein